MRRLIRRLIRFAFWLLIARPLALVVLGLNARHRERLPRTGPAIIAANHNSHLDTLVLVSLFPLSLLSTLRPVAADYFLRNRWLAWFTQHVIGILPIDRETQGGRDPFQPCEDVLDRGDIFILFPEGSRGEPEVLGRSNAVSPSWPGAGLRCPSHRCSCKDWARRCPRTTPS